MGEIYFPGSNCSQKEIQWLAIGGARPHKFDRTLSTGEAAAQSLPHVSPEIVDTAKKAGVTVALGGVSLVTSGCSSESENITINSNEAVRMGSGFVFGVLAAAKEAKESLHPRNWWQIGTNGAAGFTFGYMGADYLQGGERLPKIVDALTVLTDIAYIAKTSDPARWIARRSSAIKAEFVANRQEQERTVYQEGLIRDARSMNINISSAARSKLSEMGLDSYGNPIPQRGRGRRNRFENREE